MGLNLRSGALSCWKCGTHGWAETLSALTGLDSEECRKILGGGDDAPRPSRTEPKPRGQYTPPEPLEDLGPVHKKYLHNRGFDPDELERLWNLRGTTLVNRAPWSIVAPIEVGGDPVSWVSRRCSDRDMGGRHNGAAPDEESIARKTLLYGEDLTEQAIIVVEGCADAWAVGPGCVSTMGVGYTRSQIARIARYPVRAVVFDTERQAQIASARCCRVLMALPGVTVRVELEHGSDPADCIRSAAGRRELAELRKQFLS